MLPPTPLDALQRLVVALCIGLFIGLEREHSQSHPDHSLTVGLRTQGLVALLGAVTCYLALLLTPSLLVAGFVVLGGLVITAYLSTAAAQRQHAQHTAEAHPSTGLGVTSEVAALLSFSLGALAMLGQLVVAGVLTVGATVVLSAKEPLHRLARGMGDEEMRATLKFAAVTFIVLPILPREGYGPFGALEPYNIWLMVVLISGLSFLGYGLIKLFGARKGIAWSSIVGGLASSTAVTVGHARRAREQPELVGPLSLGIVLAAVISVARVLVLVGALAPVLLRTAAWPLLAMAVTALLGAGWLAQLTRNGDTAAPAEAVPQANPFALGPALVFAAIFAVVSVFVAWAQQSEAVAGLYAVAGISGLVQVDAPVISFSQEVTRGALEPLVATQGIVLAVAVNTLAKATMAATIGGRQLAARTAPALVAIALAGGLVVWLLHALG
ncbi:MAG TPA: hypothetical protein DCZ72_03995 [Armatimonadetes bacterium]|nr:hypothetical protein [Armatimonadota bacterium]